MPTTSLAGRKQRLRHALAISLAFALAVFTSVAAANPFMACMERTIALLEDGILPPVAIAESAVETCRAQAPMEFDDSNLRAAMDRTRAEVIEIFSHRVQETRAIQRTTPAPEQ